MNQMYEEYFGGVDVHMGRSRIVSDISKNRISREKLEELIRLLSEKGLLHDEPFSPQKDNRQWNLEYLETIRSRFLAGVFSEVYLYHLSEVSKYYYTKKRKTTVKIIVTAVIAVIAVIIISVKAFA